MLLLLRPLLLTWLLTSCAGYHFRNVSNPLAQFEISSVAVPMFFNRSNIPQVAGPLTREISLLLSHYRDLKVVPGESHSTDAILLGIIDSPKYRSLSLQNGGGVTVNPRQHGPFILPQSKTISLSLTLILIKHPTHRDIEMMLSPLGEYIYNHPRIVLQQTLALSGSYSTEISTDRSLDSGAPVMFTRNNGLQNRQINKMAEKAAQDFHEMILSAF